MTPPIWFTFAAIAFYVGITLTFLNRDSALDSPTARSPIQQAAR